MANYASAKKRIRQTVKRTEVNRTRLSTIRGALRKVEEAIASGDEPAAREAFKVAEPLVARGAQKGVMPRNTAARRISNRIKALAA
jgi:small subunit ribosomal protein S20